MQKIMRLQILSMFLSLMSSSAYAAAAAGAGDVRRPGAAATAGVGSVVAPAESFEETLVFCTTVAQDNIIWIEGLQTYWAKPANAEAVKDKMKRSRPYLTTAIAESFFQIMMDGYKEEKGEWEKILGEMGGLTKLDVFLNKLLNKIMMRKQDLKCIQYGAVHSDEKVSENFNVNIGHLYPGNEENTEAQLKSFEAIFYKLLSFANPEYQSNYDQINYDYVGCGGALRIIYDLGVKEKMQSFEDGFDIITAYGDRIRLPYTSPIDLKAKIYFATNLMNMASDLVVRFPDSNLEVILSNLEKDKASEFIERYKASKKRYLTRHAGSGRGAVDGAADTRSIDDLLAGLEEKPTGGKGSVSKRGNGTASREGGASGSSKAAGVGAAAGTETAGEHVKRVGYLDPDLIRRTLELAQQLSYGGAMPERAYASGLEDHRLSADNRIMLANLLKVNVDGRYGELKAPHVYVWDNLVGLLKELGFTMRGKQKFVYDPVRQIKLHYLHCDDRRLNGDLLGIMFKQLANIGFSKDYLESRLES